MAICLQTIPVCPASVIPMGAGSSTDEAAETTGDISGGRRRRRSIDRLKRNLKTMTTTKSRIAQWIYRPKKKKKLFPGF